MRVFLAKLTPLEVSMKRRDFVFGSAAAAGAALIPSGAHAQAAPLAPAQSFSLFDRSSSLDPLTTANVTFDSQCRDVVFDGKKFLALSVAPGRLGSNVVGSVTATDPNGNRIWSYALPSGRYWSLGTYQSMIVVFSASAVLLLDPNTGNLSSIGPGNGTVPRFAGDSTFFTVANQEVQIWTLGSSLTQKLGGITAQALTTTEPATGYLQSGNIAVVSCDGASTALISASSGSVIEYQIASDLITDAVNQATSIASGTGANTVVITAIGGDQTGNVLALVAGYATKAGPALVQLDANANVSYVANLQLPRRPRGAPIVARKLVGISSQIGVVSAAGVLTWYPRPAA